MPDTEPTPLNILMHRDPLGLSERDLDDIIKALRKSRKNFINGDTKAGSMKPLSKAAKARKEIAKELAPVDLANLGI